MSQNQRLILAMGISILIMFVWQEYYVTPNMHKTVVNTVAAAAPKISAAERVQDRGLLLSESKKDRVTFANDQVSGSINLRGARIDDLLLKRYHQTINSGSDEVVLLSPSATSAPHFITIGWVSKDKDLVLPDAHTLWRVNHASIKPHAPITLTWKNPQDVLFSIDITIDSDYMLNIEQSVSNKDNRSITLSPYAAISRGRNGDKPENMIVHQGAVAVVDGKLHEITFEDLIKETKVEFKKGINWFGFSDKYWLTTLITKTPQAEARFSSHALHGEARLQADLLYPAVHLEAGSVSAVTTKLFAGAKNLDLLEKYQREFDLPLFDRAVDFGMLYFITKPIFLVLHAFYDYIGNFGAAILLLTVLIKMLLFPIAYKGYVGMNRMRDLQPLMAELKERYKDDTSGFQKALMELYKREKVNPAAGCLPILLQMPVFFALYKVLYVTIEMRHAPFFGWIHDLSAPDPTSIFNLFGLIAWNPPTFLMIGVFPILMSLTMYIQQRLNPEPTDPIQAQMMRLLPLIFLFMFSSFPSGMVIYWAWSNVLSIIQQVLIKRITA